MEKLEMTKKNKIFNEKNIGNVVKLIKDASIFLLTFLVTILLFTTVLWIFNININKFFLPFEFLLSIINFIGFKLLNNKVNNKIKKTDNKLQKKDFINIGISIIIATIIFTVAVFIGSRIYDTTQDGNSYHKLAVGFMKNNFNPLHQASKEFTKEKGSLVTIVDSSRNNLWVDHYAIGNEIIGANIYAFTDRIESGKICTMSMMFICFGITLEYLYSNRKMNIIEALLITFVLVVNPITLVQIGNYYVDSTIMLSLAIIILELISISNNKKENKVEKYGILALALAICINAKFTGLAYCAVFCGVFYLYWLIRTWKLEKDNFKNEFRINTLFYIFTVLVATCIIGMSSYAKNMVVYGSPLYPLYGKGHVENMVNGEITNELASKPKIEQFLISIFSKSKNVSQEYVPIEERENPEIKLPFVTRSSEIKNFCIPDLRMGGFGVFFSGIFIISSVITVIAVIDFIKNKKYDTLVQYGLVVLVSLSLVSLLYGSYWARYVPYIYFIPVMNLVYLFEKNKKFTNITGWILLIIMLANSLIITKEVAYSYVSNTRTCKRALFDFVQYAEGKESVDISYPVFAAQGVEFNIDDFNVKVNINQENKEQMQRDGFYFKY